MKILINSDNIIIDMSEKMERVDDGILVKGVIYQPSLSIIDISDTIPENVKPLKYKYVDDQFVLNEDYVEPVDDIANIQKELEETKRALAELTMYISTLDGGV